MIAEVGAGRATHRAIAARAGVPLGATTYYFPTLADLVAAGLEEGTVDCERLLAAWSAALAGADDVGAELARLAAAWVRADPAGARVEYELYLAAARAPELRPLARVWLDGMLALLAPHTPAPAPAVALLDGAMLQSIVTGDPIPEAALAGALRALLAPAPPP